MQCLLNLTADECSKIITYLMGGFIKSCEELDVFDLVDEKERADFDELMQKDTNAMPQDSLPPLLFFQNLI